MVKMERFKNTCFFSYGMQQALEEILGGHQISDFSRKWLETSGLDDDTIRATYHILKRIGLNDNKIAKNPRLLSINPNTIERNYQRLVALGLSDRRIVTNFHLLTKNPETIERNYQRLSALRLNKKNIATFASLLNM